jgi:hypothetical protein
VTAHPLARVLDAAAHGSFPRPDGVTELLPPDPWGWSAVVALTGHAYVLADLAAAELDALGADGYGGASHPAVLRRIAGPDGEIGSLDAVLAGAPGARPPARRRGLRRRGPAAGGGAGHGRRLIRAALAALTPGETVWAQVAPGNAQSLRAFLACGFVPIGSEVLIRPAT